MTGAMMIFATLDTYSRFEGIRQRDTIQSVSCEGR